MVLWSEKALLLNHLEVICGPSPLEFSYSMVTSKIAGHAEYVKKFFKNTTHKINSRWKHKKMLIVFISKEVVGVYYLPQLSILFFLF